MSDDALMVKRSERDRRRLPPDHFAEHPGLATLVDENDHKHSEAHQRLRTDFRELQERLDNALGLLRDDIVTTRNKMTEMAATPIDATKLVLTPKIVASIVFVVVGIAGGFWASTSGLRSDMEKILITMESEKRVTDANAKLLELNNSTVKESMLAISKRQEYQQLQIAQINEQLVRLTSTSQPRR